MGANANQTISITFADLNTDFGATAASQAGIDGSTSADLDIFTNLNVTAAGTTSGDETIDLAAQVITGSAQSTTLGYIDTAIARVSSHRATMGATVNRLEYATDNLTSISQNSRAARKSDNGHGLCCGDNEACANADYSAGGYGGFSPSKSTCKVSAIATPIGRTA